MAKPRKHLLGEVTTRINITAAPNDRRTDGHAAIYTSPLRCAATDCRFYDQCKVSEITVTSLLEPFKPDVRVEWRNTRGCVDVAYLVCHSKELGKNALTKHHKPPRKKKKAKR
jgi:hypothetical protein